MLWDKCDYFIAAYESPNFSAAAAKIPMSPQGFAKAIRGLERELGVRLFVTEENGIRRATAYGEEFYRYACKVRAEHNLLSGAFDRIESSGNTKIRIVCSLGIPGFLGSEFPDGFNEAHPGVVVSFVEMPDLLCETSLRDGLYDASICVTPCGSDIEVTELFSTPISFWVRADNPLSGKPSLGLTDIADQRIAMPGDDFKCYQTLKRSFRRAGLQDPAIVKLSEIFWIYDFVLKGKGIGFTLPFLADLDVFSASDEVATKRFDDQTWSFGFAHMKDHDLDETELDLLSDLRRHVAGLMDGRGHTFEHRSNEAGCVSSGVALGAQPARIS